jgi:hypothetical protein
MDFDVVDARLGPGDMRVEDGLHPSTTTGRWKYEKTIREWFAYRAEPQHQPRPTTARQQQLMPYPHPQQQRHQHHQQQRPPTQRRQQHTTVRPVSNLQQNSNSTQPFIVAGEEGTREQANRATKNRQPSFPSTALIKYYPHKLRTREQYFRENEPPKELEDSKDQLYIAANLYYQYRHYTEESRKWKIYEQVATRKEQEERTDVSMTEVEELPMARPYRERYSKILNMTISDSDTDKDKDKEKEKEGNSSSSSSAENSSDTDEEDKKKRKLHNTSLSPKNKTKGSRISLRKNKNKSRKKAKVPIESDPRAPEGSPILLVQEQEQRPAEQTATEVAIRTRSRRPDTPASPRAKRPRLFSHQAKPPRGTRTQSLSPSARDISPTPLDISPTLPRTPPGLPEPPALSPRQSTPRSPVATPQPMEDNPIEQTRTVRTPSVISKDTAFIGIDTFNFPIIPIECKYHFKIFRREADAAAIKDHREFLEIKARQQEQELEQSLNKFSEQLRKKVVQYTRNSIEPLIDILAQSNQKRLDNLVLDQIREKALRTIRDKATKISQENIDTAQNRFERTLQLRFQLNKLDRRFNENMPPPALNIMDKLEFRSKELAKEAKEQYTEQWNSVLRKSKLELTAIMRSAKVAEIDKAEKEHREMIEKIPAELRQPYSDLIHTVQIRHDRTVQKKVDFLDKKEQRTKEK